MKNIKETTRIVRQAAGKLGAAALNGDPKKKSLAAKKAADTRKKLNPKVFKEMGMKRFKNKKNGGKDEQTK
jgi:hypothetical protein